MPKLKVRVAPSWLGLLPMVRGDRQIIDQPLFARLKERARSQGFNVTALVLPPHTPRNR